MLQRRHTETGSQQVREDLERYMSTRPCKACGGARLKPESRAVKVHGRSIVELSRQTIGDALRWLY